MFKKFKIGVKDFFTERNDPMIWSKELKPHYCGDYSYASVNTRRVLSSFSQVELGSRATFVGIYDGHNGSNVASYINEHLFEYFVGAVSEERGFHEGLLTETINAMENQLHVKATQDISQNFATVGSSCMIALIHNGSLFVRNFGEAKCIVGMKHFDQIVPDQVNEVDNLENEMARFHFQNQHPGENDAIVESTQGVFKIKDKIKYTKSLGDAYLKYPDCAIHNPQLAAFHIREPSSRPYVSIELQNPAHTLRFLSNYTKFIIIASEALWKYLSNDQAVRIVETHPKRGIARILIQEAQKVAASASGYGYRNFRNNINHRYEVHDDITVVVIFLNHKKLARRNNSQARISVRSLSEANAQSRFADIDEHM